MGLTSLTLLIGWLKLLVRWIHENIECLKASGSTFYTIQKSNWSSGSSMTTYAVAVKSRCASAPASQKPCNQQAIRLSDSAGLAFYSTFPSQCRFLGMSDSQAKVVVFC
jgi:hypothetical protein